VLVLRDRSVVAFLRRCRNGNLGRATRAPVYLYLVGFFAGRCRSSSLWSLNGGTGTRRAPLRQLLTWKVTSTTSFIALQPKS
jgi:hypothetical protein